MPSGGARPGAGRPRGARNKANAEREKAIAKSGLTPLDYMLIVLRSVTSSDEDKQWAAEKAAPYCHPRLASIRHGGEGEEDIVVRIVA